MLRRSGIPVKAPRSDTADAESPLCRDLGAINGEFPLYWGRSEYSSCLLRLLPEMSAFFCFPGRHTFNFIRPILFRYTTLQTNVTWTVYQTRFPLVMNCFVHVLKKKKKKIKTTLEHRHRQKDFRHIEHKNMKFPANNVSTLTCLLCKILFCYYRKQLVTP